LAPFLEAAHQTLKDFGVAHEVRVISAHRTPDEMLTYAAEAKDRGLKIIIAGAGGAAHLPGMIASATVLPVIGVPVNITKLEGTRCIFIDRPNAKRRSCRDCRN
jgi:5-(carboxyamino)imidazole ribonucleotide mutase